jgi:hypothetical protein
MPATFDKLGIRFMYPENWTLETSPDLEEEGLTIYSPDGGFWSLVVREGRPDPLKMADLALDALRAEYEDLDSEPAEETLEGQDLIGYDVNFYCLDLTNTGQIRVFRRGDRTYLLLWQAEDRDLARVVPVFHAITRSLLLDGRPPLAAK